MKTTILVLLMGLMLITAKVDIYDCDDSEWHWVINQVQSEGLCPPSIEVEFGPASYFVQVPLERYTGGVCHYTLEDPALWLGKWVEKTNAYITTSWVGEFNLSHGRCLWTNVVDRWQVFIPMVRMP